MTIFQSTYTHMAANSAITALVSARIYPQQIPQRETNFPCLTFSQDSGNYIEHLSGRSETRLAEIIVDCWDKSALGAHNLAETVQTELVGFRGAFGADTAESIRLTNYFDVPPEPDTGLHRVTLRFEIAYY